MRFMLIVKATADTEAGVPPTRQLIEEMGAFNEEMVKAGVMLAGEGLHPSRRGARVRFSGSGRKVVGGPFPEVGQLIAGFWLIEEESLEAAIDWAMRCPNPMGDGADAEIEVRQVMETADFPPEILTAEERAREQILRERIERGR